MTHAPTFQWDGNDVINGIEDRLERQLNEAAERLRAKVIQNISRIGEKDNSREQVGEFPYVDSGLLSRHIFAEQTAPLTRRVFTDLPYGFWLETGTSTMSSRPFLTKTLQESANEIAQVIAEEISSP